MVKPAKKGTQRGDGGTQSDGCQRKGLMTRRELSEWLSVSERTIARLTADPSKSFPVLMVGSQIRFDPEDVKAWMRKEAVGTLQPKRAGRRESADEDAAEAVPEVQAIASDAPEVFRALACCVDELVSATAGEAGVSIGRELTARGSRLVYKVGHEGHGSTRRAFAAIDRIASRPSRGMRVRVLLDVERGAEWAAPAGWRKAGSGHWIMASIKASEPLDDVAERVAASLAHVLQRMR